MLFKNELPRLVLTLLALIDPAQTMLDSLRPWQIRTLRIEQPPSRNGVGRNHTLTFVAMDNNTIPVVPSETFPTPVPIFTPTQVTCRASWNPAVDQVFDKVWPCGAAPTTTTDWTFQVLGPLENATTGGFNFRIRLDLARNMEIDGQIYNKTFAGEASFSDSLRPFCSGGHFCGADLRPGYIPTLIAQNMTSCNGDCEWWNWDSYNRDL